MDELGGEIQVEEEEKVQEQEEKARLITQVIFLWKGKPSLRKKSRMLDVFRIGGIGESRPESCLIYRYKILMVVIGTFENH